MFQLSSAQDRPAQTANQLLPSGYSASYNYCFDGDNYHNLSFPLNYNPVVRKTASDGDTWTYSQYNGGNCGNGTGPAQGFVQGPDGGKTTTTYNGLPNTGYNGYLGHYNYPSKVVQPNGDYTERRWWQNRPINSGSVNGATLSDKPANPFVKTEYHTVQTTSGLKTAIKDYQYDKNGNMLRTDEYDWTTATIPRDSYGAPNGLPAGLTLVRSAITNYAVSTATADIGNTDPARDSNAYWSANASTLRSTAANSTVQSPSNVLNYAEFSYDNARTTGNLLTRRAWLAPSGATTISTPLTSANSIATSFTYDSNGNILTSTDALQHVTTYTYAPGLASCLNSYPTSITQSSDVPAESLTTSQTWYCSQGVLNTTTDPNTVQTARTYDILDRIRTLTEGAEQRLTTTSYSDVNRTVTTSTAFLTNNGADLSSIQSFDPRGRLVRSQSTSSACGAGGKTTVDKAYFTNTAGTANAGFTYELTSNPYCSLTSDPTMGWTRSKADNMGRTVELGRYGGSTQPAPWTTSSPTALATTTNAYGGDRVTTTDPAGAARTSIQDGLGRLTSVIEDPNNLNYTTSYQYDANNNLKLVTQTRQGIGIATSTITRQFVYDSLNRLSSAQNPESGTINYAYDPNGNLITVTAANNVVRSMSYNSRNQVKSKSYSLANTPAVTYCYDGNLYSGGTTPCTPAAPSIPYAKGRLTATATASTSTIPSTTNNYTSFSSLGWVLSSEQWLGTTPYRFSYAYFLNGALKTMTYPSARIVTYSYNSGDVQGVAASKTYASSVNYTPFGAISSATWGDSSTTRYSETNSYNSLLQLTGRNYKKGSTTLWNLTNIFPGTNNNGNIQSQTADATGAGGASVSTNYGYDTLNRLASMIESSGGTMHQNYGYDSVGNRYVAQGSSTFSSLTPATAAWFDNNNRLVTTSGQQFIYDTGGNLSQAGSATFTFDGENRMVTSTSGGATTYTYDGDGRRVQKVGPNGTVTWVYDASGELAVETGVDSVPTATLYPFVDHLGSTRLVMDQTGAVKGIHDYLPFGEEIPRSAAYATADGEPDKFTGRERDTETGLDNFLARYFAGSLGRFVRPDDPFADQDVLDPQSWNLYSYVRNSPLVYTDPTGDACVPNKSGANPTSPDDYHDDNSGGQTCKDAFSGPGGSTEVKGKQGSLLEFLFSKPVPRYVPNDTPLPERARTVLRLTYQNSRVFEPCAVGAFGFVGREGHLGPVHGELLGLVSLDSDEGASAGALFEGGVGPAAAGVEAMYSARKGSVEVSPLLFGSKEFRSQAEGPRRRGFGGAKDAASLDAVVGGLLVDPSNGEFGGYASLGAFGAGAYVRYSCH